MSSINPFNHKYMNTSKKQYRLKGGKMSLHTRKTVSENELFKLQSLEYGLSKSESELFLVLINIYSVSDKKKSLYITYEYISKAHGYNKSRPTFISSLKFFVNELFIAKDSIKSNHYWLNPIFFARIKSLVSTKEYEEK